MKIMIRTHVINGALSFLLLPVVHAATPVWIYSAPTPANVTVSSDSTTTVQYTITNQSNKPKNLQLKATAGLKASSCYLATKGSTCTLTLTVNGSQVPKQGIHSGPVLCEQGNSNQCYQPGPGHQLNISTATEPTPALHSSVYVLTNNFRTTYSIDNGSTWNAMLNQLRGSLNYQTSAIAVDVSNALYMAMGQSGSSTLAYTADGVNWSLTSALPDSSDWVYSLFALNNTLYTGTGNGNVFYSTNQGASWASAGQPDGSRVDAITVSNNTIYAGTTNGNIFSSSNNGANWSQTLAQPDGSEIKSLAVSPDGTIYVVTDTTDATASPLYSTDNGETWVSMGALPPGNNGGTTLSVVGTTVYIGTNTGNVLYTTDNGTTWATASSQPDGSAITYLITTQNALSPVFVEAAGVIPVNGSQTSVVVKNLSSTTANNVRAQLPSSLSGVTQDASDCASVAPQSNCTLRFTLYINKALRATKYPRDSK